ncbi:flagellar biosynthesis anti-sigma factor FlgM [Sandarakinorhabdus sp.]|uniref:flagellar biosynthesis anti-sigma factor FlgM n=1 Tax=Sandarakinorhabdus sp. TaxID=1916663 RepID=UPI003569D8B1
MIDGISGGGGPMRNGAGGPIGQRSAPAEATAPDPARSLRRAGPANEVLTTPAGRSALVADMAQAPPVNAARVAELKAQIAAGQYPVDPLRVADAMLTLDRGRP